MSATLSTDAMVQELQARLPYGYGAAFLMARLNIAYRWLKKKGKFKFDLKSASLTLAGGQTTALLPVDFDPGGESAMLSSITGTNVPYRAFADFDNVNMTTPTPPTGLYGAWTFYGTTVPLTAAFAPVTAVGGSPIGFTLVYHQIGTTILTQGAGIYFPSPDEFDDIIVDRAEAQVRFLYDLGGYSMLYASCEADAKTLVDEFRSTKQDLSGLVDQIRQSQEFLARKSMAG